MKNKYKPVMCDYCLDCGMHKGCPECGLREDQKNFNPHLFPPICNFCFGFGKADGCPECGQAEEVEDEEFDEEIRVAFLDMDDVVDESNEDGIFTCVAIN